MKQTIVICRTEWDQLSAHLDSGGALESYAYALTKRSTSQSSSKILVNELILPRKDDYHTQTSSRVVLKPEFTRRALERCLSEGFDLLDIHTHPFSLVDVEFSSIDDHQAISIKAPYFKKYLPETRISFIVFGKQFSNAKARVWNGTTKQLNPIDNIIIL